MSLKAKLEAVIYAAEEPVTLAQLAIIFADEALALKAELDAARAEDAAETAASPVNETFDYADTTSDAAAEPMGETAGIDEPETEETRKETAPEEAPTAEPAEAAENAVARDEHSVVDPVADARQAARQRDKEVRAILRALLDEILDTYVTDGHGIEVREIAGGFRMATKPECHDSVRAFIKGQKPPLKLSLPALETLAVVAYKQPVTAPEVNEIRGVDSSGVFGSLLARKLIATVGRKQVIGRPILYKTTKEFVLRFGLKDLAELPSMEEFEKMAAIELGESDTADAGMANEVQTPELDENASEDESGEITPDAADAYNTESSRTKPESNPSETAPPGAE